MARRLQLIPVVISAIVLAVAITIGFRDTQDPVRPSSVALHAFGTPTVAVQGSWPAKPKRVRPASYTVADATVPVVDLFSAPGTPLTENATMDNPTHENLPVVFLVIKEQGDYLNVHVSRRPNGFTAWVKKDQVKTRKVEHSILVEVGTRKVKVLSGDTVVYETTGAVGTDRTPTPLGYFFVDGWVPLEGNGPYGAGQLSVAGFSEVLHSFGGGIGQIALHGTNRPELLGQAVSNGCVRMDNEAIKKLAEYAPLGTPVEIVA